MKLRNNLQQKLGMDLEETEDGSYGRNWTKSMKETLKRMERNLWKKDVNEIRRIWEMNGKKLLKSFF